MSWYRIEITHKASGNELMDAFEEIHIDELLPTPPTDVSVYHHKITADNHIYYFSPGASKLAPELLRQFNATACAEEPDLSHFQEIRI